MALILIELDIYVVFFEGKSRNHFLVFLTYSNLLSSVFFRGKRKKESLIHLLHGSSAAAPLLRYLSTFVLLNGSLQRRRLSSKYIYLLSSRQAVNVKLIQQSLANTSQILKTKLVLLLLKILPYRCLLVPLIKPSSQTNL